MTIFTTESVINGLVSFKGVDAGKFLQGQLTCDIDTLTAQKSLPGAYCTPQGRIRANFIIVQYADDNFLMILPKEQVPFVLEALSPYIAFFQCTMEDISSQWHLFGLYTTEDSKPLHINQQIELPEKAWEVVSGNEMICVSLPGNSRRWLCISGQDRDLTSNFEAMDEKQWKELEMLSGLIWINETSRDRFLPHDISLPDLGAVSFTKGCYVGQEIVARMQYRGEPKYSLGIIKTEAIEEKPQDQLIQLVNNEEHSKIGESVEMLHLDNNSWLICAALKRELLEEQKIPLYSGERMIICSIMKPELIEESKNT